MRAASTTRRKGMDVVDEYAAIRAEQTSVTDECRRLAEVLLLDAVGVVTEDAGRRRVVFWAAPGCPPVPARLDDVLEGRAEGWIVCPLEGDSVVFARMTPHSSVRTQAVLKAVGPSLAAAAAGRDPEAGRAAAVTFADSVSVLEGQGRVRAALGRVAEQLGFESAALFVPMPGRGWHLVERIGPGHPWDVVLDPATLASKDEAAVYPDAAAVPGLGGRLAALGCGSVAVLPVPDGGRLILSSERSGRRLEWVEGARPLFALASVMSEELADLARSDRVTEEMAAIKRVAVTAQAAVETPSESVGDLLESVRDALGAEEVFHLLDRGGAFDVQSSPPAGWPLRVPKELRGTLLSLSASDPIDDGTARQLGVVLGAKSHVLSAACCREARPMEVVLVGWKSGARLSRESLTLVAQVIGAARTAIESRRQAVDTMMLRERTRWASEIHDGLTQTVTTAVLELEAFRQRIEADPQEAVAVLDSTKAEIRKALSEFRGLLFDLTQEGGPPPRGDEPLTRYVHDVVRRWRLPARISLEGDLEQVPKPVLGAAYVVIREALANAAKHASAASVTVCIAATPEALTIEVKDSGRGFTPTAGAGGRRHFGIEMMKRRVAEVYGTLEIQSDRGEGTRVTARLPVSSEGEEA